MTDKQAYLALCEEEKDIPVFSRPFWLDAVCGEDGWDARVVTKDGCVVAALPFPLRRRCGFRAITMPPLTQSLRLWLAYPPTEKYEKRLSFETEMLHELIDKLPPFDLFRLSLYRSLTNWQPFHSRGFRQTTLYTYVIEDLSNLEAVLARFSHAKRKNIKRAEKQVEVGTDLPARDFYENHKMTLAGQGKAISYPFDRFQRVYDAVYSRNCGKAFHATGPEGNLHAALLVIWDPLQAYDLISTIDPAFRKSGAASLVVWEAIKYVAGRTARFDFEGSMIEGVARSFRQFGAVQVPYFCIEAVRSRLLVAAFALREVFKPRQNPPT